MPSENQSASSKVFRSIINIQQWGIIIVLILLVIILGISSPVFLSARNIRNILQQVSTLGILSMGMTVLMISGGIDLSVGSSISVVAVIVGKLLKAGVPAGYPIIITEGYPITDLGDKFEWIGGATVGKVPFIVILFFTVMLICFFILKYTRLGRKAYAIGGNEYTTYLAGINVRMYKVIFYMFCGFLTGLASLVLSSRISSAIPTMGAGFELQSIGAVVIGGTPLTGGRGSVWGTLTGVLLLGIIANGLNLLHVEASWQYVVTGVVIIIAVILHEHRAQ